MVAADRRIGNAAGTLPLHHAVRSTTDTRNGDAPCPHDAEADPAYANACCPRHADARSAGA